MYFVEGGVNYVLHRKLVELRKSKGITQKELAKRLNITRSALSQYEIGTRNPDYETLQRMADYFEVTTDVLLGRIATPEIKKEQTEFVIKEMVKKYDIDLTEPGKRKKLEQLIQFVFDSEVDKKSP